MLLCFSTNQNCVGFEADAALETRKGFEELRKATEMAPRDATVVPYLAAVAAAMDG